MPEGTASAESRLPVHAAAMEAIRVRHEQHAQVRRARKAAADARSAEGLERRAQDSAAVIVAVGERRGQLQRDRLAERTARLNRRIERRARAIERPWTRDWTTWALILALPVGAAGASLVPLHPVGTAFG